MRSWKCIFCRPLNYWSLWHAHLNVWLWPIADGGDEASTFPPRLPAVVHEKKIESPLRLEVRLMQHRNLYVENNFRHSCIYRDIYSKHMDRRFGIVMDDNGLLSRPEIGSRQDFAALNDVPGLVRFQHNLPSKRKSNVPGAFNH